MRGKPAMRPNAPCWWGRILSEVKRAAIAAAKAGPTFKEIAEEYLAKQKRAKRSERTLDKVTWLLGLAYPELGKRPLDAIKAADIFPVLQAVELSGRHETARRRRSTIGAVFRYAISTGRGEADPTVGPERSFDRSNRHATSGRHRAEEARRHCCGAIDGFDGQPTTHAALKLMALLFPRPGELRAAEWTEFDFDKAEWTIPASRAKMRRPHRMPLPPQAVANLEELRGHTGRGRLVFPSVRTVLRPISRTRSMRPCGGWAMPRTRPRPTASVPQRPHCSTSAAFGTPDAIERQLAHVEGNAVRRAYARGEHWEERVRMMAWWADYLDGLLSYARVP